LRSLKRLGPITVLVGLVLAACTSSSPSGSPAGSGGTADLHGATVTVIGTWTDAEQASFLAMVKPWEDSTGAKVKYQGTRAINDILAAGVPTGVLPDMAGIPGLGQLHEYVTAGVMQPLDNVLDTATYTSETPKGLTDLGVVDGKTYGVFLKASLKGLIFYNPSLHDYSAAVPATWTDLMSQAAANKGNAKAIWCLGLSSGDASGWPATDWIENILLRQSGPQVYNDWWAGKVKWTDPAIKAAFTTYMDDIVANAYGGGTTANATKFDVAGDPIFASTPGCELFQQANFITGQGAFAKKTAGKDFNAFAMPAFNDQFAKALEGGGDLFGMFHATPAAKSLMAYLVTAPAQDVWVKRGGFISANKNATDYADEFTRNLAASVTNAGDQLVYDASDQMPTDMNAAFWTHMVSLTSNKETIDQALTALQKVADDAYSS
jgi:alpha-glucoside transport system substrate-binding protein